MTKPCPIPGCKETRRHSDVMCRRHWFMVLPELRDQIWKLNRRRPQSHAHMQAISDAIKYVASLEGGEP